LVDWEFTCAVDEDIDIFSELLDRKRKFDRNLTGEAFNKGMAPKQGETLSTLYPGFPQSKIMFIGEQNSAPNEYVGFATYGTKYEGFGRPYFWLEDIFIDPERRSGGAGTKMMERLAAEADKLGCTHMWWIVDQGNLRGINFYEKLGAKIDERDIYTNMDRMKWVPSSLQ
jgi:GNAT superfamily N-acetyltransferase